MRQFTTSQDCAYGLNILSSSHSCQAINNSLYIITNITLMPKNKNSVVSSRIMLLWIYHGELSAKDAEVESVAVVRIGKDIDDQWGTYKRYRIGTGGQRISSRRGQRNRWAVRWVCWSFHAATDAITAAAADITAATAAGRWHYHCHRDRWLSSHQFFSLLNKF